MDDNKSFIPAVVIGIAIVVLAAALAYGKKSDVNVSVAPPGTPVVVSAPSGGSQGSSQPINISYPSNGASQQTFGSAAGDTTNWTAGYFSADLGVGGYASLTNVEIGTATSKVDLWKTATTTVDVDNLAAGGGTSTGVAISGASVGDTVLIGIVGSWAAPSSTIVVRGSVTSTGQVQLTWQNSSSSGAVNLTSALYNVEVISH